MKTIFKVICLFVIGSIITNGNCAEAYRVHGQIVVEDGIGVSSRTIPANVVSGVPLILEGLLGKNVSLVFVIEPAPSVKYSLTVSLMSKPKTAEGFSTTLLTQTYQSNLVGGTNGPFEFKMEQDGLIMSGVIGISRKR